MRPTRTGLILNPNMDLDFITLELEKIGYVVRNKEKASISKYLQAAVAFNGHASFSDGEGSSKRIMTENVDLFLALAAMSDEPKGNYGEYWKCIKPSFTFTNNKLYKQVREIHKKGSFLNDNNYPDSFNKASYLPGDICGNLQHFKKATADEIMDFFKENKSVLPTKDTKELLRRILELNDTSI